ncbi:MAG: 50S ribosomal protein L3 [Parcubacteria group bacterium CG1_02_40_82]|uniref:Large ribosomal subunit protein uL3 n=4 Tax=Candidatus Portnoyibacteriota TaxID=1817913 RepID=A0A2M7IIE5_9BACT|nr:MAG: 50S ribosomal protein L3 [Parcubacteria group bacterium CG1_02_40_82]PIQ75139.1 MAG: 50S ribosomal protein L3 [Candidatus Portnoybacteria bacterium CG11_big_fil_rev_8_21_14_0_20_40_15]PIS30356.1 MAG: 50S ribosomal protein L3 [Candidatus Portnoybacteria bacterium CG08_land_8_20_14_0_20_40_83]PIW76249.1 MAG: 50S ribosomal protein L3 [Candidatus Portnoybacteria bacterium CG_4_8_14_3_um_filter_40_10]PIY74238.1 MAG: 50S ribosomal protein L3 [Candidatus Portnoybacteria bacterium CG_4_10_14_0_
MKFILAKKLEMSQIFDEKGDVVPMTLVEAGPCFVTQIKNQEKDGYESVQIAFGEVKRVNKPRDGHLKKVQSSKFKVQSFGKYLKEFRAADSELKLGDEINVSIFKEGDTIKVSGLTIGRGFTGVVKRHGFKGGPASHGQKHSLRAPGSIGATFPERVPKGRRMGGRYGGERVTVRGLKIAKVDAENNILAIKGAVPGKRGTLLEISTI